jgi:hypothetical protein
MPTIILLMAVLVGPGAETNRPVSTPEAAARQAAETPYASLREARESVKAALRESNRASGRDPSETAPSVLAAWRKLGLSEDLPAGERRRLQAQLHTRLSELQSALRRREQRSATSHAGGVIANAQELIDLIQTTIAPETWEINGGNGTIFYFPNR